MSASDQPIVLLPCPVPLPDDAKSGWQVSFELLKSLSVAAEDAEGSTISLEAVEAIVLALRDKGYVAIGERSRIDIRAEAERLGVKEHDPVIGLIGQ